MRYFLFLVAFYSLLSCNKTDDTKEEEVCVGVIDFAPTAVFHIELVDKQGLNLIESGHYSKDDFKLQLNGDFWNEGISTNAENNIALYPTGSEGDNQYLIHLSESEIDTLDFALSFVEVRTKQDSGFLCGEYIVLDAARYNQIKVDTTKIGTHPTIPVVEVLVVKNTN